MPYLFLHLEGIFKELKKNPWIWLIQIYRADLLVYKPISIESPPNTEEF